MYCEYIMYKIILNIKYSMSSNLFTIPPFPPYFQFPLSIYMSINRTLVVCENNIK